MRQKIQASSIALLAVPVLALTGCATVPFDSPTANTQVSGMHGTMFGGQQPVVGATVRIYGVGTSGYGTGATLIATANAVTDSGGGFSFSPISCPYSNTPTYLLATGGNAGGGTNPNIVMATASGACGNLTSSTVVNVNEVTTVATAFAMGQFFTPTIGSSSTNATVPDPFGGTAAGSGSYNQGLVYADSYTVPALVNIAQGDATHAALTTTTSGTTTITRESAKLYTLANIIASCINSASPFTACTNLYNNAEATNTAPTDTLQAAVEIALYPYKNITNLYNLPPATSPFIGLSTAPNDWTLGISYTSSVYGLGINGTATSQTSSDIQIDSTGNVWFPSTSANGHGIGEFSPSTMSFAAPVATGLVHPQYVAIDQTNRVFATDQNTPQLVMSDGTVFDANHGTGPVQATYSSGVHNALIYQNGITQYKYDNGLIGSNGNATYSNPPNELSTYNQAGIIDGATSGSSTPCRYETNADNNGGQTTGTQIIVVSSSSNPCYAGGMAFNNATSIMTTSDGKICQYGYDSSNSTNDNASCLVPPITLSTPKALNFDGNRNVWVANSGNGSVSTFSDKDGSTNNGSETSADFTATSTLQYIHNSTNGGTMTTPYGLAIDRSGNVWVSNAGCLSTNGTACTPGSFVLSELIGVAAPTVTPLAAQNIPGTIALPTN